MVSSSYNLQDGTGHSSRSDVENRLKELRARLEGREKQDKERKLALKYRKVGQQQVPFGVDMSLTAFAVRIGPFL
jgi:hypothetical protein